MDNFANNINNKIKNDNVYLVRHPPNSNQALSIISKFESENSPIIVTFNNNKECNAFYDIIKPLTKKSVIKIIRTIDCPLLQKQKEKGGYEEDTELILMTCLQCFGKKRKIDGSKIKEQCNDIFDAKNIDEYQEKFEQILKYHKNICPHRLNMRLLKNSKNPIIITTHYGLNYHTFLDEYIKNSVVIINGANAIKNICFHTELLCDKAKKGSKIKEMIDEFIKNELTVMHIDKTKFLEIGFTEKEFKIYSELIKNAEVIMNLKLKNNNSLSFSTDLDFIKKQVETNLEKRKYESAYNAYTIYRAFDFFEKILNPLTKIEIIKVNKEDRTQHILAIKKLKKVDSLIEQRLTDKLNEAKAVFLLESFTPDPKYFPYYYGLKPNIIDIPSDEKLKIMFIGGSSNSDLTWNYKKNTDRLFHSIKSIQKVLKDNFFTPLFILRNIKEYIRIKEFIENNFITGVKLSYARGFHRDDMNQGTIPISVGLPYSNREAEKTREKTISEMCGFKIDFEEYYSDQGLTELMWGLTYNMHECKYSVALNVKAEGIKEKIKNNMPWTKNMQFTQLGGVYQYADEIGNMIAQFIQGKKQPKTNAEQRIENSIMVYIQKHGKLYTNDLKNKIKGKHDTKREVLKDLCKRFIIKKVKQENRKNYYIIPKYR